MTLSARRGHVEYVQARGGKGWRHTPFSTRRTATASKPSAAAKEEYFLQQGAPSVIGALSFAEHQLLNATAVYNQLKEQAEKFGYSTLTREEGRFLKRYKAHNDAGALTTSERVGKKRQATWSGTSSSGAPKRPTRRYTARARVTVDKSLATWQAPVSAQKAGIASWELLAGMPSIYTSEKKQRVGA